MSKEMKRMEKKKGLRDKSHEAPKPKFSITVIDGNFTPYDFGRLFAVAAIFYFTMLLLAVAFGGE